MPSIEHTTITWKDLGYNRQQGFLLLGRLLRLPDNGELVDMALNAVFADCSHGFGWNDDHTRVIECNVNLGIDGRLIDVHLNTEYVEVGKTPETEWNITEWTE